MQFIKGIRPFELIAALADRNSDKLKKDSQSVANEEQRQPSYAQAQQFMIALRRNCLSIVSQQNKVNRRVEVFQNLSIDPHYLSMLQGSKLVQFQFELGSDLFLERIQNLYEQIAEINKVVQKLLEPAAVELPSFFINVQINIEAVSRLLEKLKTMRELLHILRNRQTKKVILVLKRKKVIKQKLRLLSKVKQKNQAALANIQNIDQAFATQQNRGKLYRKIAKMTQNQNKSFISTVKTKLLSTAITIKQLVEQGLSKMADGRLEEKKVQKLMLMVFFMQRGDLYKQNNIVIVFPPELRQKLRVQILKIFEWKTFRYIKDGQTEQRVNEFLTNLLQILQQ